MNPWAGDFWVKYLEQAYNELSLPLKAYFVTVFDHDFEIPFSDVDYGNRRELLVRHLPRIQAAVRNRFRGVPFFLELDLAIHRHSRRSKRILSLHFHGLAWGSEKKVAKVLAKFQPGLGGAEGGQKSRVYDLAGALRYIAKDTRCQYATIPANPFAGIRRAYHHRERMYGPKRLMMLDLLDDWAKPELCIGSKIGSKLLKRAIAIAKGKGYVAYEGSRS